MAMKFNLPNQQVDERDTMFARMARRKNTSAYQDYYTRRPHLKKLDDRLRNMPRLMSPTGKLYNPQLSEQARYYFDAIKDIEIDNEFVSDAVTRLAGDLEVKNSILEIVRDLGAIATGITELGKEFIYSHKGRHDTDYGNRISLEHSTAIVFLVEMDFERMQQAPQAATILESARQYYRAAVISQTVAAVLIKAGFAANAHYDANYDLILPPLAIKAGLGELGRNNILVADKYGSRVRIGAITTDMSLKPDSPVDLGVDTFCRICKKCALNCPSHALELSDKIGVNGISKWPTKIEQCYSYWRQIGTDCGICMAVCPFSHRNNRFHNLVRWLIMKFGWSHRPALFFDDLIYGRRWIKRSSF